MQSDLLCKRCTEQPCKSQCCPANSCLSAAKAVCEHADNRWAEEDHAHGQRANPCWKEKEIYGQNQVEYQYAVAKYDKRHNHLHL